MADRKERPNLSRLIIDYSKELDLKERLQASAKRNKRSLNKQVEFALEEFLGFDELSEEQRLAIQKIRREMLEGLKRSQSFF
ncbi:hypothetical protein [Candidatus Albibeggiatoa sp. nov. BB20]|uniref:hypothetical protein n=1 Tax=Candidatus Albibeggiatoa sp. nov. BB20 TaxID=3162723 RepID=UPI0033655C2D